MLTTKRSLVTLKLPYARWHRVRPPASQVRQRLTSLPSRVNRCRSTRLKATVSFPGSINTEPVVRIQVRKPAEDTLIARVVRLAEEAADAKAPSERFIERFARWYMPVICALVVAVTVLPPLLWQEPWGTWIYRSLTLLLIGCPCALVISTPAAVAAALAAGARRGLLVKGGRVLEAIGKVKHIAFDMRGTLTVGRPVITDVVALGTATAEDVLRLGAAVESGSSHPLAAAIVSEARARNLTFALMTS